jgi:hypothetical protein
MQEELEENIEKNRKLTGLTKKQMQLFILKANFYVTMEEKINMIVDMKIKMENQIEELKKEVEEEKSKSK